MQTINLNLSELSEEERESFANQLFGIQDNLQDVFEPNGYFKIDGVGDEFIVTFEAS